MTALSDSGLMEPANRQSSCLRQSGLWLMTSGATSSWELKTKRFASSLAIKHDKIQMEPISMNMRKNAKLPPREVSKSIWASYLISRMTSMEKCAANRMVSSRFSKKMVSRLLLCGAMQRANGTRLEKSKTLDKPPSKLAKEALQESEQLFSILAMLFSRRVNTTRWSMLTWAMASTVNCLATMELIIWMLQTSFVPENTLVDPMLNRSSNSWDRTLCHIKREKLVTTRTKHSLKMVI